MMGFKKILKNIACDDELITLNIFNTIPLTFKGIRISFKKLIHNCLNLNLKLI